MDDVERVLTHDQRSMTGSPKNTATTAIAVCQSRARLSKDWISYDGFRDANFRTPQSESRTCDGSG